MNDTQRLRLQEMIKVNNVEDQTNVIRDLKHSSILKKELENMLSIKEQHGKSKSPEEINNLCAQECSFLFMYYTDIYNKIRKDEIDLTIFNKFLDILKKIEDKEVDQHEGSFLVGTLLKELYVDSAIKKADKFDRENPQEKVEDIPHINISWKDFKKKSYSKNI
jgi:hypothetical protein